MRDAPTDGMDLLAFAAHELQAPLRRVRAYAALLSGATAEEVERSRAVIIREAERAQRLAADIIAWRGLAASGSVPAPIALHDLVAESIAGLGEVEQADIALHLAPVSVAADARLVHPLLANLLGNALAHRKPGEPARITVTLAAHGAVARLSVSDEGVGFDPADAGRLFRPFARGRSSDAAGSGLGLAIVRAAADRLGWTVAAEGRPGEGATFSVEIPLSEP